MEVAMIPTESVLCEDRFRRDYGDMQGLIDSFKKYGIIQSLAVVRQEDESKPYRLLAGGRRFGAIQLAGIEEIPVRIYPNELSDLEMRSIELEENIQRKDLDFIEDCNLKREIHRLQVQIHGVKTSTSPDASGWSMRDTADLINRDHKTVSRDIKLADAVESFPEADWDNCKNKKDAMKMLGRLEEKIVHANLAKQASKLLGREAKKKVEAYLTGDFFTYIAKIPDRSINFIEVDPPYAIDLPGKKSKESYAVTYGDSYNEVASEGFEDFMRRTLTECYRVMADDTWIVVWFGPDPWFNTIYDLLIETGFKTRRLCGIWTKPGGQTNRPDTYFANCYEMFYYASKGDAKINTAKRGRSNIFKFSPVTPTHKIHPTERPVELIEELLDCFAWEGARVVVPFAGSGNTLRASYNKGMFPIGYDLTTEYREGYVARIIQEELKDG